MPRSLDPEVPVELVLDCDFDKAPQPTFFAQHLTTRMWLVFVEEYEGMFAQARLSDQVKETFTLLRKYLVNWRDIVDRKGAAIAFDLAMLEDVLDPFEAMELLGQMFRGGRVSHDDKKKLESPPSSSSDSSAKTAASGSASKRRQN